MLGCHDFCGHYDWTFHYVRRRWGQEALALLLRESISGESQHHYTKHVAEKGLRALYEAWVKTGEDEHCDWTFTLDEEKNVLRFDMRECPSKGFLIQNDRNADEDYCNHCTGWMIPMLESIGAELIEHEHNHCGQCWATMRMKNRQSQPLQVDVDIRNDPRWKRGYLDRWANNRPLPLCPSVSPSSDPCEVLESWFRAFDTISVVDDAAYNDPQKVVSEPMGVLIGCPPADLAATAARYNAVKPAGRPLLMHALLPGVPFVDFVSAGLPRPTPILPLLIRKGVYMHQPGGPHPTTSEFLRMLTKALGKQCE